MIGRHRRLMQAALPKAAAIALALLFSAPMAHADCNSSAASDITSCIAGAAKASFNTDVIKDGYELATNYPECIPLLSDPSGEFAALIAVVLVDKATLGIGDGLDGVKQCQGQIPNLLADAAIKVSDEIGDLIGFKIPDDIRAQGKQAILDWINSVIADTPPLQAIKSELDCACAAAILGGDAAKKELQQLVQAAQDCGAALSDVACAIEQGLQSAISDIGQLGEQLWQSVKSCLGAVTGQKSVLDCLRDAGAAIDTIAGWLKSAGQAAVDFLSDLASWGEKALQYGECAVTFGLYCPHDDPGPQPPPPNLHCNGVVCTTGQCGGDLQDRCVACDSTNIAGAVQGDGVCGCQSGLTPHYSPSPSGPILASCTADCDSPKQVIGGVCQCPHQGEKVIYVSGKAECGCSWGNELKDGKCQPIQCPASQHVGSDGKTCQCNKDYEEPDPKNPQACVNICNVQIASGTLDAHFAYTYDRATKSCSPCQAGQSNKDNQCGAECDSGSVEPTTGGGCQQCPANTQATYTTPGSSIGSCPPCGDDATSKPGSTACSPLQCAAGAHAGSHLCCPDNYQAQGDVCCPTGSQAAGHLCCPPGTQPSPWAPICVSSKDNSTVPGTAGLVCDDSNLCCRFGSHPEGGRCIPNNQSANDDGTCCPAGYTGDAAGCCPSGWDIQTKTDKGKKTKVCVPEIPQSDQDGSDLPKPTKDSGKSSGKSGSQSGDSSMPALAASKSCTAPGGYVLSCPSAQCRDPKDASHCVPRLTGTEVGADSTCVSICAADSRYLQLQQEGTRKGGKLQPGGASNVTQIAGFYRCIPCGEGREVDPNDSTVCKNICAPGQHFKTSLRGALSTELLANANPCEKCASGKTDPKDPTKCLALVSPRPDRTLRETTERPSKPKVGGSGETAKPATISCGPRMRLNSSRTGCIPDLDIGGAGPPGSAVHGVAPAIPTTRGR